MISVWTHQAHCQCVLPRSEHHTESFSSLATVTGLPFPSGIELILKENGARVEATLRDYAGELQPRETKLSGGLREKQSGKTTTCEVDMKGTNKDGPVRIHGTIRPSDFLGTIQRHMGKDSYLEKVSLRRRVQQEDLDTGAL